MTAREHMEKHLRQLPSGGLAWDRGIFAKRLVPDAVDLIDVAVDIAWDRLYAGKQMDRPSLDVYSRDGMIVFRVKQDVSRKLSRQAA